MAAESFDSWALVELMGHQRIAGRVTEAEIGGCKFVRVDVPELEGRQAITKFLGPSSIYAITPVTEATARGLAQRIDAAPLTTWDAEALVNLMRDSGPKELPAPARYIPLDEEELDDDDIPL